MSSDSDSDSGGPRVKGKYKPWSSDEEKKLAALITKYNDIQDKSGKKMCWHLASKELGTGRTSRQCREHYINSMIPDIKKGQWTPKEEYIIAKEHAALGAQWMRISKQLPGRTDNSVKNYFNATIRSKRPKPNRFLWLYINGLQTGGLTPKQSLAHATETWPNHVAPDVVQEVLHGGPPAAATAGMKDPDEAPVPKAVVDAQKSSSALPDKGPVPQKPSRPRRAQRSNQSSADPDAAQPPLTRIKRDAQGVSDEPVDVAVEGGEKGRGKKRRVDSGAALDCGLVQQQLDGPQDPAVDSSVSSQHPHNMTFECHPQQQQPNLDSHLQQPQQPMDGHQQQLQPTLDSQQEPSLGIGSHQPQPALDSHLPQATLGSGPHQATLGSQATLNSQQQQPQLPLDSHPHARQQGEGSCEPAVAGLKVEGREREAPESDQERMRQAHILRAAELQKALYERLMGIL